MRDYSNQMCPGYTGGACDNRRCEFDLKNGQLLRRGKSPDVVFIGDSITHFMSLTALYGDMGMTLVNRGIGGDTVQGVEHRFEADAVQLEPRAIVLMIGVNNTADMNDGSAEKAEEIFCTVTQGLERMLKKANCIMAVCSVLPTNVSGDAVHKQRGELINCINSHLKKLCADNAAWYVDYHSALVQADGITVRDGLTIDGLHPHAVGYEIMRTCLEPVLKQMLNM